MKHSYYIQPDKLLRLSRTKEITTIVLADFIAEHKQLVTSRYSILKNAYIGQYPLLNEKDKDPYKPDNRVIVNFAKYLVDTMNGFFIGIPIKTSSDNENINDYLSFLDKYNDQDDNNAELSKMCSIYGKGYEVYFNDEEGNVAITYMDPMEGFMIYDDTPMQIPRAFVSYYYDDDNVLHGEVRDATSIREFEEKGGIHFIDEGVQHGFDGIPATEYIENEERMAIFESTYSMINAYSKAISEKANDVDYFGDAYMKVLGAALDDNTLTKVRDSRVINLEGDGASDVVVDFMEKPSADTTQENLLTRFERLIYQISMVANISDESFGTSSGIALKYKLLSMSNLAKTKERKFTSGMNRRYMLIFSNPINKMNANDWLDINYKFSQNYPANLQEEAEIAKNLDGIVSKETQLATLSNVEDVQAEINRIDIADAKDAEDIISNRMFGNNNEIEYE